MNLENHPCFSDGARHKFGRIHLPVAPKCNIQCNFCDRKYDCVNESRPGVTSVILSPKQSLSYLKNIMEKKDNIKVVGIAGPGDPFANPDETMETLRLVRENYPEMLLCIATNGLDAPLYVKEMAKLSVSHVTITLNAIEPEIGSKIYSWIRKDKRIYHGVEGAKILLENQLETLRLLKENNIVAKINAIIIPGINDNHIIEVAKKAKELGADILNCMPLIPNPGTIFEKIIEPDKAMVARLKLEAGKIMPQMHNCTRCRADAVGLINESNTAEINELLLKSSKLPADCDPKRTYFAVASMEGIFVNQHLGETESISIYRENNGTIEYVESRITPAKGLGNERWLKFNELLKDCKAIFVSGVGGKPKEIIKKSGVKIYQVEGFIEEILNELIGGKDTKRFTKREGCGKGLGCTGNGGGCG